MNFDKTVLFKNIYGSFPMMKLSYHPLGSKIIKKSPKSFEIFLLHELGCYNEQPQNDCNLSNGKLSMSKWKCFWGDERLNSSFSSVPSVTCIHLANDFSSSHFGKSFSLHQTHTETLVPSRYYLSLKIDFLIFPYLFSMCQSYDSIILPCLRHENIVYKSTIRKNVEVYASFYNNEW